MSLEASSGPSGVSLSSSSLQVLSHLSQQNVQHQSGDLRSMESIWHSACHNWRSTHAGRAGVPHTPAGRELAFHTCGSESCRSTPAGVRAEAGAARVSGVLFCMLIPVTDSSSWVSPLKIFFQKITGIKYEHSLN